MKNCKTCLIRYQCDPHHENICLNNNNCYYMKDESVKEECDQKDEIKMDDILEKIKSDMSLDDVGNILKCALCTMYDKLKNEEDFYNGDMYCIVPSIGSEDYDTEVIFVECPTYTSDHRATYRI